jgi:hypothetical protein
VKRRAQNTGESVPVPIYNISRDKQISGRHPSSRIHDQLQNIYSRCVLTAQRCSPGTCRQKVIDTWVSDQVPRVNAAPE